MATFNSDKTARYCRDCESSDEVYSYHTLSDGTVLSECEACDNWIVSGDFYYALLLRTITMVFPRIYELRDTPGADRLMRATLLSYINEDGSIGIDSIEQLIPDEVADLFNVYESFGLTVLFNAMRDDPERYSLTGTNRYSARSALKDFYPTLQQRWAAACYSHADNEPYKRLLWNTMHAAQALEDSLA